jgi:hypothetical protein
LWLPGDFFGSPGRNRRSIDGIAAASLGSQTLPGFSWDWSHGTAAAACGIFGAPAPSDSSHGGRDSVARQQQHTSRCDIGGRHVVREQRPQRLFHRFRVGGVCFE